MIKAEGIHKTFEDFTALDNITCSISDGWHGRLQR